MAIMENRETLRSHPRRSFSAFQPILKLGVIVTCLGLLYAQVSKEMVLDWIRVPDYSHGFLVLVVSLYLVHARKKELSTFHISGHWTGLGLILVGIVLLLMGNLAGMYFTMRFSMLVVIGGIVLFLLGKIFFRALLFPLAFLILMIPPPSILTEPISFPMQIFASKVAAGFLYSIGIPVLREGNVIHLTNCSLEVAEACSGIRSLISLVTLSVVFAYLSQKESWKRILLVFSSLPIAILANAARVSGAGTLAHYYGPSVADDFFHGFSGVIVFVLAFSCLLGVGRLLSGTSSTVRRTRNK